MTAKKRIYLDHAATSWPKEESVLDAMDQFARNCGATAGRGAYRSSLAAGEILAKARLGIAEIIGAESPQCISFHSGGTSALNTAIHGLLKSGDHVVTTAAEHNSVLRPLHALQQQGDIRLTIAPVDATGTLSADDLIQAVTDDTRLVAVTAASNVTGAVEPIDEIGQRLAGHPCCFLCDAAQTFGLLPIDVQASSIDLLAAPGHKSSGGPSGTGFLYVSERIHSDIRPTVQGGTGSLSESMAMPTTMPGKLEAGSLNGPAIAGWLQAIQLRGPNLTSSSNASQRDHASQLAQELHDGLQGIAGVTLFGKPGPLPIASLQVAGFPPSDIAMILDAEYGIEVRSGRHCAALIHDFLGTADGGTLRISAGRTTTSGDLKAVVDAITQIAESLQPTASIQEETS